MPVDPVAHLKLIAGGLGVRSRRLVRPVDAAADWGFDAGHHWVPDVLEHLERCCPSAHFSELSALAPERFAQVMELADDPTLTEAIDEFASHRDRVLHLDPTVRAAALALGTDLIPNRVHGHDRPPPELVRWGEQLVAVEALVESLQQLLSRLRDLIAPPADQRPPVSISSFLEGRESFRVMQVPAGPTASQEHARGIARAERTKLAEHRYRRHTRLRHR